MNNEPERSPEPDMPENMPEAPPGWLWRVERTPTGIKRLILLPAPPEGQGEASQQETD